MVAKQTIYNRRWIEKNKDKHVAYIVKHNTWKAIAIEFRKIGIYDSFEDKRGRPRKNNNK